MVCLSSKVELRPMKRVQPICSNLFRKVHKILCVPYRERLCACVLRLHIICHGRIGSRGTFDIEQSEDERIKCKCLPTHDTAITQQGEREVNITLCENLSSVRMYSLQDLTDVQNYTDQSILLFITILDTLSNYNKPNLHLIRQAFIII
jgi:hypothetical protein